VEYNLHLGHRNVNARIAEKLAADYPALAEKGFEDAKRE
jgi:hypothetical protein